MTTSLWVAGAIALACVVAVCSALSRVKHPIWRAFASSVLGIASLGAVNLFAGYTGVGIALNYATAFVAVVLSAPGVITLLFLRILLLF